jgi:glycosyltransferase involved in cell wall biosynthesis
LKYSVIIPTLNEEKLLPNLIKQLDNSALKLKYGYEIIISDGGSTDKTVEEALDQSDIIKIHVDEVRQNIALGRNEGARYAVGEVLIFLNGDIILPGVEEFFDYIENNFINSKFAAMTCSVKIFKSEEKISDVIFHFLYNNYFYLLNFFRIGMARGECQIIRKKYFDLVKGNNSALYAGEDFDLFKRISRHGKIFFARDLCVFESPRRYRKIGYLGVTWLWIKNSISIIFRNKSLSKDWEQVR